jgi:antitoxin MazE
MLTSVRKWGNSLGVRIPKAAARKARVTEGTVVDVIGEAGRLLIVPVREPQYELEDLLREVSPKNLHREVDWGRPAGQEAW